MRKIIIALFLSLGFILNTSAYSLKEGVLMVRELEKKLENTPYTLEFNEGGSSEGYYIFYNGKRVGHIYASEKGITTWSGWEGTGEVKTNFEVKYPTTEALLLMTFTKLYDEEPQAQKPQIIYNKKVVFTYNGKTKGTAKKEYLLAKNKVNKQVVEKLDKELIKIENLLKNYDLEKLIQFLDDLTTRIQKVKSPKNALILDYIEKKLVLIFYDSIDKDIVIIQKEAKEGNIVLVHYIGYFDNGEVFENSYDRGSPLEFTLGAREMIPGFESAIYGMKVGDKKSITLSPEEGYGERDESRVEVISRSELEGYESMGIVLEVGQTLPTMIGNLPILETTEDTITIDTNSPLAGKTLNFDIKLVEIK